MTVDREQEIRAQKYLEGGSRTERERRKKRKLRRKKRKRNFILFMILLVLLLITGVVALVAYITTNVYQDEAEFKEYVDRQLETGQLFVAEDKADIEYEYGSPISYAVDYDTYSNEDIAGFRDEKIGIIKRNFTAAKRAEEKAREKEHGHEFRYRPLEYALIVSSRVYESENGVISLAIYEQDDAEIKKNMETVSSKVYTYQFSEMTGNRLTPLQIFTEDYREKCTSYFLDFFKKEYD